MLLKLDRYELNYLLPDYKPIKVQTLPPAKALLKSQPMKPTVAPLQYPPAAFSHSTPALTPALPQLASYMPTPSTPAPPASPAYLHHQSIVAPHNPAKTLPTHQIFPVQTFPSIPATTDCDRLYPFHTSHSPPADTNATATHEPPQSKGLRGQSLPKFGKVNRA